MGPQLSFEWIIENYLEHRTICKDLFITSLVHSWLIISHPNEKIKAAFAVSHYRINRMNHFFLRSAAPKQRIRQNGASCQSCAQLVMVTRQRQGGWWMRTLATALGLTLIGSNGQTSILKVCILWIIKKRRRPKCSIHPFMISEQGGVSDQGPVSLSDISLSVITCTSQPLVSSHYQDLFTIRLRAFCPVSIYCR